MEFFSVIIINYNTAELLLDCLASLLQHKEDGIREIIVVDNASSDQSVALVREHFPAVRLIALDENIGFGRANNLALESCTGDLFFLLNPDTRVLSGCFEAIRYYMDRNPEVGMAGTAIFGTDRVRHTTVQSAYPGSRYMGGRFASLPGEIAWLLGASLVVRREVMLRVQGFDPDFFLYGEDIDLSMRIRKAGWALGYIPEAGIVHVGGQSERTTALADLWEKKMRGELLFLAKHYPPGIVRKIRRARLLQAWWRILTLRLAGSCCRSRQAQQAIQEKLTKYSVATRAYR